jgi:effector-binding domain-containing protein
MEAPVTHAIQVKQLPEQPVAIIRAKVKMADIGAKIGEILPEIWHNLTERGIQPSGPPFTLYFAREGDSVDMAGGVPVPSPIEPKGRVEPASLPAGEAATAWHIGPYDTLTDTYGAIMDWAKQNDRTLTSHVWEVYWTDPGEVPNPAEWKTEIVWALN